MAGYVFEDGEVLSEQKINEHLNHSLLKPVAYTPALTNIAGSAIGSFMRIGKLVMVEFLITTTGPGVASLWGMSTPSNMDVAGSSHALGVAQAVDASVGHGSRRALTVYRATATGVSFMLDSSTGASILAGSPWAWANGDTIGGRFSYWEA